MSKNVIWTWILLGLSVILIAAASVADRYSKPDAQPIVSDADPHIEMSMDEEVSLVGPVVEEWSQWEREAITLYQQYRSHGRVYSGKNVVLKWGVYDIPQGSFIKKQSFELSRDPDFTNIQRYELRSGERSIELPRLLPETQYYFRVTMELENCEACVQEGTFRTKWSPRIIDFENLNNIRDIGGWKTTGGKTVRQEMLYRGCELDGASDKKRVITDNAVDVMVNELKIKTELDLRSSDQSGVRDMLGVNVSHQYIALPSYSGTFTASGNQKLRLIFATLANPDNYPIYLHCSNGMDRTGIVCFLLEAMLGVPQEDCYREWELSVLATGSDKYSDMDLFMRNLNGLRGETLQEKAQNYLLSIGVTAEEIETIRGIMLR